MNVVSLFSGIGGFDLGLERAGCRVVLQVENDSFCQRVLAARWPDVARADDVRHIQPEHGRHRPYVAGLNGSWSAHDASRPDLLVGGFPCQDLSVAGKRAGLGGARSSLFHEFVRIAKILRPSLLLVENVPGLLSSDGGADVGIVLDSLHEAGYLTEVEECDSQHFGVPQRRRRLFFIGVDARSGLQTPTHFSSVTLAAVIAGSLLEAWELLDRPSAIESLGLDGAEPSRADTGLLRKMRSYAAGPGESPWPTLLEVLAERHQASESAPHTWVCPCEIPDGDKARKATGPGNPIIAVDTSTVKSWRQLWGDLWQAPSVSTISTWSKGTTAERICTCAEATLTISRLTEAWSGSCPHCWTVASLCLTGLLVCIASLNRIADDLFVPSDWRDHARVLLAETETRVCDLVGGPAEAGVAQVLALTESGSGDLAAGGEAGTDLAVSLTSGSHGAGVNAPGRRNEDDVNLVMPDVAYALAAGAGGSKFGSGRDAQDTFVTSVADPISANEGRTYTHEGRNNFRLHNVVTHALIALDTTQLTHPENRANPQPGAPGHPLAAGMHAPTIAYALGSHAGAADGDQTNRSHARGGPVGMNVSEEMAYSLREHRTQSVAHAAIRRLTPLECERLQGFPDGWTCLCQPLGAYAEPDAAALRCRCPDSPRYRALGNAVSVPVIQWLGHRLSALL